MKFDRSPINLYASFLSTQFISMGGNYILTFPSMLYTRGKKSRPREWNLISSPTNHHDKLVLCKSSNIDTSDTLPLMGKESCQGPSLLKRKQTFQKESSPKYDKKQNREHVMRDINESCCMKRDGDNHDC